MADFQVSVNMYAACGVPGAAASKNPIISPAKGRIAKVDCPIGGFVWDDDEVEGTVKPEGSGKPVGFVHRDVIYTLNNGVKAANVVPAGDNVDIAVKGDFFVICEGAVKGDAVYADASTGAVATEGEETDFIFATNADENGYAVISSK